MHIEGAYIQEGQAEMWVYLENCFHNNCICESEKALLVPVSTKGILADHERATGLNNTINKTHISF